METEIDIEKPEQGNQEEDMRDREMPGKEAECIYQPTYIRYKHARDTYRHIPRTHANYEVPKNSTGEIGQHSVPPRGKPEDMIYPAIKH